MKIIIFYPGEVWSYSSRWFILLRFITDSGGGRAGKGRGGTRRDEEGKEVCWGRGGEWEDMYVRGWWMKGNVWEGMMDERKCMGGEDGWKEMYVGGEGFS